MAKLLNIEIGVSQIRVAVVNQSGKVKKITNVFRFQTPQGAVEDGSIRDTQSVSERLKEELAVHNLTAVKKVIFTVFSSRIATREVSVPFTKEKQIQSMVEANAMDYFPIDITKYILTYQVLGAEEKDGVKQHRLSVYASPKSISASYVETAQMAGLTIEMIDYLGNSIYQAGKEIDQQGVHMAVKIEENTTLITILRDGELSLQRNLNYGIGTAVDVVQMYPVFGTDLSYEEAYEVLREQNCIRGELDYPAEYRETEDQDEGIYEARREVTESLRYLCGNISRIMDYYISRHADTEFDTIVIAGMGAECKGLTNLLSHELGQIVENAQAPQSTGYRSDMSEDGSSAALYLAVIGCMYHPINLMEPTEKSRKKKKQEESLKGAYVVLATAVGASLLLAAAAGGIHGYQYLTKKSLESKIEKLKPMEDLYRTYSDAKKQYADFIAMYQYTETPNEKLKEFFEEMESKLPSSMTVSSFQSTGEGVDMTLSVNGKAEAAKVLISLEEFESLAEVTSTGLSTEESGQITFSLHAVYADPAVSLPDSQTLN